MARSFGEREVPSCGHDCGKTPPERIMQVGWPIMENQIPRFAQPRAPGEHLREGKLFEDMEIAVLAELVGPVQHFIQ